MSRPLLALGLALLALPACDWQQAALMNSVPVKGDPARNAVVRVYLGLDGLSYGTVARARERGAFQDWALARFIPMFPATSDASWSRILRTERFEGYEFGHYDPLQDAVLNPGLAGVVVHAIPPLDTLSFLLPEYARAPAYYGAFDHHAASYVDGAVSYQLPVLDWYRSLDSLFVTLAGRAESQDTFTAYVLEGDVIGHLDSEDALVDVLVALSGRIADFERRHPERRFVFTLFGDHGIDAVHKPSDCVVDFRDQLRAAGVTPVDTLAQADAVEGPAAVTVLHTRVTYVALHTRPGSAADVARLASTTPAADLVVARSEAPGPGFPQGLEWVGAWRGGALVARFGYQRETDTYWLPTDVDWAALDVPVHVAAGERVASFSDEDLFALTAARTYPDFFFRARTALEPVSVRYPADVVVSFRDPYMSVGFQVPVVAGNDVGAAGSHGALHGGGSVSALLSEERALPAHVRSDNLLELFPSLARHLDARGVVREPGADGAALDYAQLP